MTLVWIFAALNFLVALWLARLSYQVRAEARAAADRLTVKAYEFERWRIQWLGGLLNEFNLSIRLLVEVGISPEIVPRLRALAEEGKIKLNEIEPDYMAACARLSASK